MPNNEKTFIDSSSIDLTVGQSRNETIDYLKSIRDRNVTAELAFYVYRDMEFCDWQPFIKAAIERNPVCVEQALSMSLDEVYGWLGQMPNESIYDGKRLAQPDEVANYVRGDGLEKAFVLAAVAYQEGNETNIKMSILESRVVLEISPKSEESKKYEFISTKGFRREVDISI